MSRTLIVLAMSVTFLSCRTPPETQPISRETAQAPAPGDEPLETSTIGDERVQTIPEEPVARYDEPVNDATAEGSRACTWSSVWSKPSMPNPVLAGVGGIPMPTRIHVVDAQFPVDSIERTGQIVAEIVITPDGDVMGATIIHSLEPRWAAAEEALLNAARQWKYEPPRLGRIPISVCTTLVVEP